MKKMVAKIEFVSESTTVPYSIMEYCLDALGDKTDVHCIETMEATAENLAACRAWLATKENTVRELQAYHGGTYYSIFAYALEFYEGDDDGEFMGGSDYEFAADKKYEVEMTVMYTVEIDYWSNSQGYSHTETIDSGKTDRFFTAEEWLRGLDTPIEYPEGSYEVRVQFYEDGADPQFDDPIGESECSSSILK